MALSPEQNKRRVDSICARIKRHVQRARGAGRTSLDAWLAIIPLVRELKEYCGGVEFAKRASELGVGSNYANDIVRFGLRERVGEIRAHFLAAEKEATDQGKPYRLPSLPAIINFSRPERKRRPTTTVDALRRELADARRQLAQRDAEIATRDTIIAARDAEIVRLKARRALQRRPQARYSSAA